MFELSTDLVHMHSINQSCFIKYLIKSLVIILGVIFTVSAPVRAALTDSDIQINVLQVTEDITDVNQVLISNQFQQPEERDNVSHGFAWLKITWDSDKLKDEQWLVNDEYFIQVVEEYYLVKDEQVIEVVDLGVISPYNPQTQHYKNVIDISNADYVILKTCCDSSLPNYFHIFNHQELSEHYYFGIIKYTALYLIIFSFVLYNFILGFFLKDTKYYWYCLYLICAVLGLLSLSGIGRAFIWSDNEYMYLFHYSRGLFFSMTSILFIMYFLDPRFLSSRSIQVARFLLFLQLFTVITFVVANILFPHDFFYLMVLYITVVKFLSLMAIINNDYMIIRSVFSGDKTAKVLMLGYGVINIALAVFMLRNKYILADNDFTVMTQEIAVVIESVILSLALAQSIQSLRKEKLAVEEHQRRLQEQYSWNLLTAQENEKKQLSSTLHDNFTHELLLLKSSIQKGDNKEEDAHKVEQILHDMRNLSHIIHPAILEKLGLQEAIANMCDKFMEAFNVEIFYTCNNIEGLEKKHTLVIYRVVQEALNNVIKHAEASECIVVILKKENNILLTIKDDGKGFDVNQNGFGIETMRQRCRMLGGELTIESDKNGTNIFASFNI